MPKWDVLGIDPAPSKPSVVCVNGNEFLRVPAGELAVWVGNHIAHRARIVIAWDAPLSFDEANDYSDRPIDRRVRAALKEQSRRLTPGAVSVLPFSSCPHWAITAAVLGVPTSSPRHGLKLAESVAHSDKLLIEVHPAVSLAVWWLAMPGRAVFPKYKGLPPKRRTAALARIRTALVHLSAPQQVEEDDDHLDAWVAWKMADEFLRGESAWIGSPREGGYVLPRDAGHILGLRES